MSPLERPVTAAPRHAGLIKSYPLLSFYIIAFAVSWGVILIAVGLGPGGFSATPQQLQAAVPYAVPAMHAGPGIAGLLLTGVLSGRAGFRALLTRLLRWRFGARWYAIALLTAPLLIMAVFLALSLISPMFHPRI
jgi:hypothetical protein